MENKRILFFICFVICMIFAISSVNAGIFEFVDDTGDIDDTPNPDIDKNDVKSKNDKKYEVKKFKIEFLDSSSVLDDLIGLQDEIDDGLSDDFETAYWLTDLMDYVFFEENDGGYLIVNESEADKIPSSSKYSSCTIECKVIDTHFSEWGDYYLVKDIKVLKKEKKSSSSKSSSSSSESTSTEDIDDYMYYDSDSSSSSSSSSSNYDSQSSNYVGNAATGKFHAYSCHDVGKMDQSNMVFFGSRGDAIDQGYVPCGHCRP